MSRRGKNTNVVHTLHTSVTQEQNMTLQPLTQSDISRNITMYLLRCVARSHPVVHDDALVAGVPLIMFLVPLGADLVQAFLLVRKHHRVHRLRR